MARLILIRHGETDWNREGRWQGQVDIPLNAQGLEQAEALARRMAGSGLTALYSSDLVRAVQTAEALARVAGLAVVLEPRLREINQGVWQGLQATEIQAHYADLLQKRATDPWSVAPPGGETSRQVQARVLAGVGQILHRHPGGTIGVVSHGFTLALIRVHHGGYPASALWELIPNNCEPVEIHVPDA